MDTHILIPAVISAVYFIFAVSMGNFRLQKTLVYELRFKPCHFFLRCKTLPNLWNDEVLEAPLLGKLSCSSARDCVIIHKPTKTA